MFDKFGNMNFEELNMCAAGLKNEGDEKSLKALAVENGLDPEDAEDYMDGADCLATPLMAALGKIKVESKELKPVDIMEDWVTYIRIQCQESEEMAKAVREKEKSLKGCIGALLKWSFAHQRNVDKELMKAAGVNVGRCTLGIPGMGQAKKIINAYYLGR